MPRHAAMCQQRKGRKRLQASKRGSKKMLDLKYWLFKCFMGKEMHSTPFLDFKQIYAPFCVNKTETLGLFPRKLDT